MRFILIRGKKQSTLMEYPELDGNDQFADADLCGRGMRKFESAEKEECLCLNDQGGERMDVSVDVTATLRAGMSGHPPLVMGIQQGSAGTEETPDPALTEEAETGGNNQQILFENHGIDARVYRSA